MPLSPEQIATLVADKVAKLKPYYRQGKVQPMPQPKSRGDGADHLPMWPEYWPGYNEQVERKRRLSIHIQKGADPTEILKTKAPNQSPEEFSFALANFRQTTLPIFSDFANTVQRALADDNWALDFAGDTSEPDHPRGYFTKLPKYGSIRGYVRNYLVKIKTLDPMGVLLVMPERLPVVQRADGTTVIDPDSLVEPLPIYVPVEHLWHFDPDTPAVMLKVPATSVVEYNGKPAAIGLVLWIVDEVACYEVKQVGKAVDLDFEVATYFEHGLGELPAQQLKGVPNVTPEGITWESPYAAAQEPLDLALIDTNNLQLVKLATVYPHTVEIGDDCDFVDNATGGQCSGGQLRWVEDLPEGGTAERERTCPKCKGTGITSRMGPLGKLLVRPPTRGEAGESAALSGALQFISPSTQTLDFLRKEIDANTGNARRILHLESERGFMAGGEAATATEKGLDQKSTIAFVRPIADQIFELLGNVIDWSARMRYGADKWEGVTITKPTTYDLRTEADYMAELKAANAAGLAPPLVEAIQWSYLQSRYGSDPGTLLALEDIARADRLFGLPAAQVQAMLQQGTAEAWEVVLHFSGLSCWEALQREDPTFKAAEEAERITRLQARAVQITPEVKAPTVADLVGGMIPS